MKNFFKTSFLLGAFGLAFSTLAQAQEKDKAYTFDPSRVRRDPFTPPLEVSDQKLDDIFRYDVLEFRLVAVMSGLGPTQAMLVIPNGTSFIVQQGDRIGKRRGIVTSIRPSEILIRESYVNNLGQKKSNLVSLVLAE